LKKKRKRAKKATARPAPPPVKPRRSPFRGLLIGTGIIVIASVIWFFIGRDLPGDTSMPGGDTGSQPNVLLITLDTVRADHVGCYGNADASTPTIDTLAATGVRFEEAYAQVPLTLPSHVSMLTGLHPLSTGVQVNGALALGPGVPTLSEVFKGHGYRTAAFIGADVMESSYGLTRGFDHYSDDFGEDDTSGQRPADQVTDAALNWLNREPGGTFFAWAHYYDPHTPYTPPAEFSAGAASAYAGEISFVDSQIQRLLSWLDENGLREQTMVIVVGDHGEGLLDHQEDSHGHFVYNTTMRVPWIVEYPALLSKPQTVATPVQLVDLFPTVLDLLGWDTSEFALDGRSLAQACTTGKAEAQPVYGESEYPRLGFGWAPLRFIIKDQWKYIEAPRAELYNLESDPDELDNVIEANRDVAERLRADLAEYVTYLRENRPDVGSTTPDQETIDRLASLGYATTTSTPDDFDDGLLRSDPKDMTAVVSGYGRGLVLYRGNNFDGAIRVLAPLVEQSPESSQVSELLGLSYLKLNRDWEAQQVLEASLDSNPDNRSVWFSLGVAHKKQNQAEDALACFEQAIALSPDWAKPHREAATVLSQLRRIQDAEPHWRRCVELDPASAHCLTNLGTTFVMTRRVDQAVPLLERALVHEPANEAAHKVLWKALQSVGRRADAVTALDKANDFYPGSADFCCPLAWFLATTSDTPSDDIDRAIELANACTAVAPGSARSFDALAAAYAASGNFTEAVEHIRHALDLVKRSGPENLQRVIEARLTLYQSGRPYLEK